MKGGRYSKFAVLVLSSALILGGCASQQLNVSPEDAVRARASERWQAMIEKNWAKAYSFNTPAYRGMVSFDDYKARQGAVVIYKRAEVSEVKCQESSCELRVFVEFTPVQKGFGDATTSFSERWVKDEQGWWLFQNF